MQRELKGWTVFSVVLVCLAAGSLMTARLAHADQSEAAGDRVFEFRV